MGLAQYSLEDLKYTEFQKPYFATSSAIDFNISHSGNYVVCALSETSCLGVDVEWIKPMPIDDFQENFSEQEWNAIQQSKDTFRAFYSNWTQKEAFLKALGVGLNLPLDEIFFTNQKIVWEGKAWFSQEIVLDDEYVCHLVSSAAQPAVSLKQVSFS
jgi:4'-phosphopantetheinyl transferase